MRNAIKIILLITLLILSGSIAFGETEVTPKNVHQFLETGEMSYTIQVNFTRITWKTEDEYQKEIRKAEEALSRNPNDLEKVIEYLLVCKEAGRSDLAKETAAKYVEAIHRDYAERQDETSARRFLIATNVTGPREAYITAYEDILPFLESGNAELSTVYAALENRELAEDYQLGFRIAEFYQQIYPDDAELFFRGFLLTLNNSLYSTIPYMIQAIRNQMDDLEGFLFEYFNVLEQSLYFDLLDRALELEPDNYQYLLASVGFRALVRWFSQMGTMMQEEDIELSTLQDIFNMMNLEHDERLEADLSKALKVRPEKDIQIYLAAALFHATNGDARHAAEFVQKALQLRKDIPEVYDARIFTVMLEVAEQERQPSYEQQKMIENLLLEKMNYAGRNGYDLYVLAGLRLLHIREGVTERERATLLEEMEMYALESIEEDDTVLGRIVLGNAMLMQGRIDEAARTYQNTMPMASDNFLYALHANLGVAYFMQGKTEQGKKEIRAAADLLEGDLRAEELLLE